MNPLSEKKKNSTRVDSLQMLGEILVSPGSPIHVLSVLVLPLPMVGDGLAIFFFNFYLFIYF